LIRLLCRRDAAGRDFARRLVLWGMLVYVPPWLLGGCSGGFSAATIATSLDFPGKAG